MFTKKDLFVYLFFIAAYLLILFGFHKEIFQYQESPNLINQYLNSQDIEGEVEQRVFISDADIYLASGYLYTQGNSPTNFNFQHPPLIKYLFGFSAKFLGNPYYVQMVFGVLLLGLTYFLGIKLFSKRLIALVATLFLLIDPVFMNLSTQTLLDLGQAVFALGYLGAFVFLPENFLVQGIILGLFAASKFWSTAAIWFTFLIIFQIFVLQKRINILKTFYSLVIALIVFSITYIQAFLVIEWQFNIFHYQLKVLKFMLSHNSAPGLGGSVVLFVTGYFTKWWNRLEPLKGDVWSFLWPMSLLFNLWALIRPKFTKIQSVVYLLPLAYFILTVTQVPFTRYFIVILPLLYLVLSNELFRLRAKISK
jgi:hypothetical protein